MRPTHGSKTIITLLGDAYRLNRNSAIAFNALGDKELNNFTASSFNGPVQGCLALFVSGIDISSRVDGQLGSAPLAIGGSTPSLRP